MKGYKENGKMNNKGFSLVEVLIAMAILAIVSLPILATFSNAARINSRAKKIENATTAANNILEEAKVSNVNKLTDIHSKTDCKYTLTSDNNGILTYYVGNKTDANGNQYYEGNNGERFYITAEFDPTVYTSHDGNTTENKLNDVNSSSISVYSDITGPNNYVFRDDSCDEAAMSHFQYIVGDSYDRKNISKKTDINVNVTATRANECEFIQTVTIVMTYHYDSHASYSDYVKTTTLSPNVFTGDKVLNEDGISYHYEVSGRKADNIKNLYVFYSPFDENTERRDDFNKEINCNDVININYFYEKNFYSSVDFDNCNVYVIQQDKYVKHLTTDYHLKVSEDNVNVKINNVVMDTATEKAGSMASNVTKKEPAVRIYSNIKGWKSNNYKVNTYDGMFRIKITVYYNDPSRNDESIMAEITSTKKQ